MNAKMIVKVSLSKNKTKIPAIHLSSIYSVRQHQIPCLSDIFWWMLSSQLKTNKTKTALLLVPHLLHLFSISVGNTSQPDLFRPFYYL